MIAVSVTKALQKMKHTTLLCPVSVLPLQQTSQLISCINQLTGFYIRATLSLNGLKKFCEVSKLVLKILKHLRVAIFPEIFSMATSGSGH